MSGTGKRNDTEKTVSTGLALCASLGRWKAICIELQDASNLA